MDLVNQRLIAHAKYISSKITDEKKKDEFIDAIDALLLKSKYIFLSDRHGGLEMALDIYKEIVQIHKERFGADGRSGNFYLEKL